MVQNRVTIVRGAFRQVRRLAEGQKARTSKRISQYHPPPPTQTIGGGGRISREICRFFPIGAIIWWKGVKSPRKRQVLGCFAHYSAEGSPGWTAARFVVF